MISLEFYSKKYFQAGLNEPIKSPTTNPATNSNLTNLNVIKITIIDMANRKYIDPPIIRNFNSLEVDYARHIIKHKKIYTITKKLDKSYFSITKRKLGLEYLLASIFKTYNGTTTL